MLKLIEDNKLYFRLYFIFFILLFAYQLNNIQTDALIFFSSHRTSFGDFFFKILTRFGEEWAFIILTVFYFFTKKKNQALKIAFAGLSVLLVVQILKIVFIHDRPVTVFEQNGTLMQLKLVEGYNILRGATSFPSGHSAAGFTLGTIMAFYFNKNFYAVVLFFTLAVLVGISRVYLVAHFPEDVLFGSAIGVGIAMGIQHFMDKKAIV